MSKCKCAVVAFVLAMTGTAEAQTRGTAGSSKSQPVVDTASANIQSLEAKLQEVMAGGGGGLTSDEVARKAMAASPEIKAKTFGVEAADAKVNQTYAQFFPKVTSQARYTRLSPIEQPPWPPQDKNSPNLVFTRDPPGTVNPVTQSVRLSLTFPVFLNNYNLSAGVVVPVSDYLLRFVQAVSAAKGSKRMAEFEREATRYQTSANGRLAYYEWVRSLAQKFVAQQALEQAKGHRADAQRAFDVGMVSRADVLRSESAVKGAELLVSRTTTANTIMEERLRVLMHDTEGSHYAVGENILENLPPSSEGQSLDALVHEALEKRMEPKALEQGEDALDKTAWVQKVGMLPRVDLAANAQYANPNQRLIPNKDEFTPSWDASVVVSWSPTDAWLAGATGGETQAKRRQVAAQREGLVDGLRVEVAQSYEGLKVAEAAIETTHSALVASEESYRVRRDLYRNGRSTSVEVTDAETDLTKARFDAINARIDHRQAKVRFAHAVGRDVASGGGSP
jgi:outer membrane protein TolC